MEPNEAGPTAIHIGAVGGDLHIRTWGGEADSPAQARLTDDDGRVVTLSAGDAPMVHGDATLLVAGAAEVTVARVGGDLSVSRLGGALRIEVIGGDAVLQGVTGAVVLGQVQGDTTAVGLEDDLTIVTAHGDVAIDNMRGTLRLGDVMGDLNLRNATQVEITSVEGDLRGQDLQEITLAGDVQGDVTLAHMARCTLHAVQGDLTALDIREMLQVPNVEGDVRLRETGGQVRLAEVSGDLAVQDALGGILAEVAGEAYLETPLVAGMTYHVVAEGIVLRARSPISAQFVATTEGGEVRTHLPLTVERHRQHLVGVMGAGEAVVTLTSTGGDILVDAAGTEHAGDAPSDRRKDAKERGGFRVHIDTGPGGPRIDVGGETLAALIGREMATSWPFKGDFSMSNSENTPHDTSDLEQQLQDLGERTSRAARKAADRMREYTDKAAQRARVTDWDAVRRDVRNAIERTVGELDSFFREIAAEFERPAGSTVDGTAADAKKAGPTAQRIHIERDDDLTAKPTVTPDAPVDQSVHTPADDRAAQRRTILEQLRSGDLSLEDAESRLKDL
ncbi:MAG: hypothetical protein H0X24_19050 [Ktedonobacterales bacterium]|nr:hypothetical protein [Ktedonobacterales bacterium]